jgi:hypothetical protein
MPDILVALKTNILAVEAEIERVQIRVKKECANPLRREESEKELRALNIRLKALQQNLASEASARASSELA